MECVVNCLLWLTQNSWINAWIINFFGVANTLILIVVCTGLSIEFHYEDKFNKLRNNNE